MALISNGTTLASGGALIGAGGGVEFITNFSGGASVSVSNCFSNDHNSYIVNLTRKHHPSIGSQLFLRFLTSGTSQYTSNYFFSHGVASSMSNSTYQSQGYLHYEQDANQGSATIFVNKPYQSTYTTWNGMGLYSQSSTNIYKFNFGGFVDATNSFTGIYLQATSGSVLEGSVWGFKNS